MSHLVEPETSHRRVPDLLLSFSAAAGIVVGAIVLLATTQTVVALVVAVAVLVALLAAGTALVIRMSADEGDDVESPGEPAAVAHDGDSIPLNRRRHDVPTDRAA
jgi:hypothetical protein